MTDPNFNPAVFERQLYPSQVGENTEDLRLSELQQQLPEFSALMKLRKQDLQKLAARIYPGLMQFTDDKPTLAAKLADLYQRGYPPAVQWINVAVQTQPPTALPFWTGPQDVGFAEYIRARQRSPSYSRSRSRRRRGEYQAAPYTPYMPSRL